MKNYILWMALIIGVPCTAATQKETIASKDSTRINGIGSNTQPYTNPRLYTGSNIAVTKSGLSRPPIKHVTGNTDRTILICTVPHLLTSAALKTLLQQQTIFPKNIMHQPAFHKLYRIAAVLLIINLLYSR